MKKLSVTFFLLVTTLMAPAYAQQTAAPAPAATALSDGEIRKVDRDAQKITIRHGPIVNLGMPPMTMVFQAKDPALLDQVKVGDKVKFVADNVNGAYVVTRIESLK